jgi:hypothetical protein
MLPTKTDVRRPVRWATGGASSLPRRFGDLPPVLFLAVAVLVFLAGTGTGLESELSCLRFDPEATLLCPFWTVWAIKSKRKGFLDLRRTEQIGSAFGSSVVSGTIHTKLGQCWTCFQPPLSLIFVRSTFALLCTSDLSDKWHPLY